jgi:hypothetical protein
MNDDNTDLNQVDEDILTYTVSDEALEAAAGTGHPLVNTEFMSCHGTHFCVEAGTQ